MRMTWKEYQDKPAAYREMKDGTPYLLYLDPDGAGTVWGPVTIVRYRLTAYYCEDEFNYYWAFEFEEIDNPKAPKIRGYVSGGESNIYGVLRYWDIEADDWDRTIDFQKMKISERKFDKMFLGKNRSRTLCDSREIAEYIKKEMKNAK